MPAWVKISEHKHTGKLRSHEHTSYVFLGMLLFVVGFALTSFTSYAYVGRGPGAGSVGMSGVVAGKPPTSAAHITSPTDGQHFSTTPITVKGTCPTDSLVEIFKNDIFAGSTPCNTDGSFSLESDLLIGANVVYAKVYDALNQAGPDSNKITVWYDVLGIQGGILTSLNFGGNQLLINTDAIFRGTFPNQEMTMPIDIIGGRAPYAVNIQWGDGTNKVISRTDNQTFRVGHVYEKAGTYQLSLQATDADGRVAFLTVASIVNGQPPVAETTTASKSVTDNLLLLWPLYAATFAVVISFWIGEWREKRMLAKHHLLILDQNV